MTDQSPSGELSQELDYCGELASRYFHFLQAAEPIERWEELVPLSEPIHTEKQYPVDEEALRELAAICPPLTETVRFAHLSDSIAPLIGLRYAWTRFRMHARLLNAIEGRFTDPYPGPTMVIEAGCCTGGLLHFLSTVWPEATGLGFDVSAVSLDVLKKLSETLHLESPPAVIRADFTQVAAKNLPPDLRERVPGSLVILSNMLGIFSQFWGNYPALQGWYANANLIRYWVDAGASVLICERHDDPRLLVETILTEAGWREGECIPALFEEFEAASTHNLYPENPIGEWLVSKACIIGFFPPVLAGRFY